MHLRDIVLDIDTLLRVFKDYMDPADLPPDAKAVKLMLHPQERKMAVVVESPSIPPGAAPYEVRFDIRRVWGGG